MASDIQRLSVNECTRDSGAAWIRQVASNCRCRLRLNCFGRSKKRSKKNQNQKNIQPLQSHFFPFLPLARELKVVPVRMRIACLLGLRLRRSPGLGDFTPVQPGQQRPSHSRSNGSAIRCSKQWLVPKIFRLTVARRRRLFTVFPCTESRVIVDGARNSPRAAYCFTSQIRNCLPAAEGHQNLNPANPKT